MADGRRTSNRWRDLWQLHVPLAAVLVLCVVATVIEVHRAGEGVWRAWIYLVEWPFIGVVAVWIWHRYRTEGNVTQGLVEKWKARVDALAEHEDDPGLRAWNEYVTDLEQRQPPGGPPPSG